MAQDVKKVSGRGGRELALIENNEDAAAWLLDPSASRGGWDPARVLEGFHGYRAASVYARAAFLGDPVNAFDVDYQFEGLNVPKPDRERRHAVFEWIKNFILSRVFLAEPTLITQVQATWWAQSL